MPDVTLPPVQIGAISGGAGQVECLGDDSSNLITQGSYGGPYKIGGAIYDLQVGRLGTFKVSCHKSLDGGLTWTEQFAGTGPAFDSSVNPLVMDSVEHAGVIYVAFFADPTPTTGLRFWTFTPGVGWAADVFPVISADLRVSNIGDKIQSEIGFDVRPDGEGVIVYGNTDGVNWNTVMRITGGGVWGAALVIATDGGTAPPGVITFPNYIFPKVVVDSLNITHGLLRQMDFNPGPGPVDQETFFYFQVSALGVLTTPKVAIEAPRPGGRSCSSRPRIFNGDILFPVALIDYRTAPPILTSAVLYTGSPKAAPVWTPTVFEAAHEEFIAQDQPGSQLFVDGTTIYFAWLFQPADKSACGIRRSINTGSGWGPVGVFYDLVANPPNATAFADQFLSFFNGGQVGSVGAAIGVLDPDTFSGIGFFLVPGAPSPPIPVPVFPPGPPGGPPAPLVGGEPATPYILNGCLIGVKRFKEC